MGSTHWLCAAEVPGLGQFEKEKGYSSPPAPLESGGAAHAQELHGNPKATLPGPGNCV